MLLEECVCYDQCILSAELCYPVSCFILYSKAKVACYSRYLLTSCFCILVPYNEKRLLSGVLVLEGLVGVHEILSTSASSVLMIGVKTLITVILNFLLWKRTDIIVIFETGNKYYIQTSC